MADSKSQAPPLRYEPSIEQPQPGEDQIIKGIIDGMTKQSQVVEKREGHAVRASHAKSTALVVGTVTINSNLPEELAQGLFAQAGEHPIAIRFAQGPGEILGDRVSTHRGMSMRIFNVSGEKQNGVETDTQDFIWATGPTFPSGTAAGFLRDGTVISGSAPLPEVVKSAVASVARQVNNYAFGGQSPFFDFFGHNFVHPFSDAYFSQAPLRYGDYVAKLAAFPVGSEEQLQEMKSMKIDTTADPNAFRTVALEWLKKHGIKYEIRAQLWRDKEKQPIEDASVIWPEYISEYQTVAVIEIPPQDAHSEARREYFDDKITFNVGSGLAAHKPLGSVMRARMQVYQEMQKWRQSENHVEKVAPKSVDEVPA